MSKTRLFQAIKSLDVAAVAALLEARPELGQVRDERGRNALHLLCSLPGSDRAGPGRSAGRAAARSWLLLDEPAFVEGPFKATPLWYAISRGRNLPLARWLLKKGSTPEYCLWAAGFQDDVDAIDLLVDSGARVDPVAEDETPFLGAIKWSHFAAAERLLHHGANVNFRNSKGMTALHFLIKKKSDRKHIAMLLGYGADPTIRNAEGESPLDMVAHRRDQALRDLFSKRGPSRRASGKAR